MFSRWFGINATLVPFAALVAVLLIDHEHRAFGDFRPSQNPETITEVNVRDARPMACGEWKQLVTELWPTTDLADPIAYFATKMRRNGATDNTWAVLDLDPETVEAAIQVAAQQGCVAKADLRRLREAAIKQLFKPNAKSFVLIHGGSGVAMLDFEEPYLISMRHGIGKLVGMSVSMGRGLKPGAAGLLMFEDRTCKHDPSYSIQMRIKDCGQTNIVGGCLGGVTREFVFEGEGNLLTLMARALADHVPKEQISPRSTQASNLSGTDILGIIGTALEVVKIIKMIL